MKKIFIISTLLLCSIRAGADSLIVDQYYSPYTGSALNLSAYHAYMKLDDRFLPSSEGKDSLGWTTARVGKLFIEYMLSSTLMVVQHEIFGHGYRAREYHFKPISYEIGIGWGSTGFSYEDFYSLSMPRRAALSAAGMEANAILSQEIRRGWMQNNVVDRREAILYLLTDLDQSEYILGTEDESTSPSNDVNGYVQDVNTWYGDSSLSKGKLRTYAIVDFLDPSLIMSFFSVGRYLVEGDPSVAMEMFDFGNYRYNFCGRLLLAPYGPEFQLQNYLSTPTLQFWQANVRYGNNSGVQSYGLDILTDKIWVYENWNFGNKFYIWRQPMFLQYNSGVDVPSRIGAAEFVNVRYKVHKNFAGYAEFGYKTAGYIQGIPLGNNWVWRFGVNFCY